MDNITNKALIIAVGIFVTIAITSGILVTINEMKVVYQKVYETDTSITSRFDEFDTYDNTVKTGIDLLNTANKYLDSDTVSVYLVGVNGKVNVDNLNKLKTGAVEDPNKVGGNIEYNVTLRKNDSYVTITFKKK